ncbi:MAG: GHKL domain-containing protein [Christensenellaceae bacterium]
MLDTLIGAGVIFLFLNKLAKQNYILSAITATLSMAVTTLVESTLSLLEYFMSAISIKAEIVHVIGGLLFYAVSFAIYRFFVDRYSIKSPYRSKYLLAFSLPIFFISIIMRMLNYIRYTTTTEGIILQSDRIQNYEVVILTAVSFLCICTILFAYEKTVKQIQSENERILLQAQLSTQENYIEEATQKYEATRAFRHDFKNHIIALRGLIESGEIEKSAAYMDRFEQVYQKATFKITTGNCVIDILLCEKLSYAEQAGIQIQYDIVVPPSVKIDDFDLCAIFSNAMDNAIKACKSMDDGDRTIDIIAKPNKDFFVIDIMNYYKPESVLKGSGIGLSTIKIIAEKYHGAVEIQDTNHCFRISVILPFDDH